MKAAPEFEFVFVTEGEKAKDGLVGGWGLYYLSSSVVYDALGRDAI